MLATQTSSREPTFAHIVTNGEVMCRKLKGFTDTVHIELLPLAETPGS
jgi:hypothetical protein